MRPGVWMSTASVTRLVTGQQILALGCSAATPIGEDLFVRFIFALVILLETDITGSRVGR